MKKINLEEFSEGEILSMQKIYAFQLMRATNIEISAWDLCEELTGIGSELWAINEGLL